MPIFYRQKMIVGQAVSSQMLDVHGIFIDQVENITIVHPS